MAFRNSGEREWMRQSLRAGNRRWRQAQYLLFGLSMAASAFLYFAFLHPADIRSGRGTITSKVFLAGEDGKVPPHYRLTIRLEAGEEEGAARGDGGRILGQGLDTVAARLFAVGQKVTVKYEERGVPLLWRRAYVKELRPL